MQDDILRHCVSTAEQYHVHIVGSLLVDAGRSQEAHVCTCELHTYLSDKAFVHISWNPLQISRSWSERKPDVSKTKSCNERKSNFKIQIKNFPNIMQRNGGISPSAFVANIGQLCEVSGTLIEQGSSK